MDVKKTLIKVYFVAISSLVMTIAIAWIYRMVVHGSKMGFDALADFLGVFFLGLIFSVIINIFLSKKLSQKMIIRASIVSTIVMAVLILLARTVGQQ